ncbi:MAG: hypothetical protein Q7J06_06545, partial [Bacteroidales bacterium]|nr:hypothetical protein [Bacteroidales bacterium]
YFLLQRGVLEEFVEHTPIDKLERALNNYDSRLPTFNSPSVEGLVLILARARIKELEKEVSCTGIL